MYGNAAKWAKRGHVTKTLVYSRSIWITVFNQKKKNRSPRVHFQMDRKKEEGTNQMNQTLLVCTVIIARYEPTSTHGCRPRYIHRPASIIDRKEGKDPRTKTYSKSHVAPTLTESRNYYTTPVRMTASCGVRVRSPLSAQLIKRPSSRGGVSHFASRLKDTKRESDPEQSNANRGSAASAVVPYGVL